MRLFRLRGAGWALAALAALGVADSSQAETLEEYQSCLGNVGNIQVYLDLNTCYAMCMRLPALGGCQKEECLHDSCKAKAAAEIRSIGVRDGEEFGNQVSQHKGVSMPGTYEGLLRCGATLYNLNKCLDAYLAEQAREAAIAKQLEGVSMQEFMGMVQDSYKAEEREVDLAVKTQCVRALAAVAAGPAQRRDPAEVSFGGVPRSDAWILQHCGQHMEAAGLAPQDVLPPGAIVGGQTPGIIVGPTPTATSGIHVIEATYGGNCAAQGFGAQRGNATAHARSVCEGQKTCDYVVQVQALGDPAPGCAKDFVARYACMGPPADTSGCTTYPDLSTNTSLR